MPARTRLLVVCAEYASGYYRSAEQLISNLCHHQWRDDGYVDLWSIEQKMLDDWDALAFKINRFARKESGQVALITLPGIKIREGTLLPNVNMFPIRNRRILRHKLPDLLRMFRVDITGYLFDEKGLSWEPGKLDQGRVDSWIRQFETMGSHGWVAQRFLQVLDFWSPTRLLDVLGLTEEELDDFDCVTVNRFEAGRSGDALGSNIRKRLRSLKGKLLPLLDLAEAIDEPSFKRVLFLEDCLLSGNELERVVRSLAGNLADGQKPRARPLERPDQLVATEVVMRFGVVSDAGTLTFERLKNTECLPKLHLDHERSSVYELLTERGALAHRCDKFRDDEGRILDYSGYLTLPVFASKVWGGAERRERAMQFCAKIGEQLFAEYLKNRNKEWIPERICQASLGYGIALAFSHSIPKVTLPLFWMHGRCSYQGKTIEWLPLFEFAM